MSVVEVRVPRAARLLADPLRWRLVRELARSDRRVRELVTAVDQPQNLVSYHLRQLRDGGLVTTRRSTFDARDVYYSLDLPECAHALAETGYAIHPGITLATAPNFAIRRHRRSRQVRVLFACTGNSARSPMAAAILGRLAPAGPVRAASAGIHPKQIHPTAVQVMRQRYGIDLSDHRPTRIDSLAGRRFDYVITLCDKARESCPEFPAQPNLIHWSLPDPAAAEEQRPPTAPFLALASALETRLNYLLLALTAS